MPQHPPTSPKFWEVWRLEQDLLKLPASDTSLSTVRLKNMGIERAPQLDIDKPNAVDAHPVFFTPVPDTPDFRRAVAEELREYCECWENEWWYHCPDERQHIDRLSCTLLVIDRLASLGHYAISIPDLYPADIPKWHGRCAGRGVSLPSYSGRSVYLKQHGDPPPQPLLEWFTPSARYLPSKTKGMRHCVGYLADNTSHKKNLDEALRSEITAGISYIRKRIQVTHDTHSTIPVLVISFYHSDTVRITQVCWNGEHNPITFRQSRLLDIASDSFDTPDIFLLVRWMQCFPLREPKVSRRRTTVAAHAPAPRTGRPATPVQKWPVNHDGTPAAAHAAGTTTAPARPATPTPTSTPTQIRPSTANGSSTSSPSSSRSATPTPTRNTVATDTAATSAAAANRSGSITAPPQASPSARHGSNARHASNDQSVSLPTRSANGSGSGSGCATESS